MFWSRLPLCALSPPPGVSHPALSSLPWARSSRAPVSAWTHVGLCRCWCLHCTGLGTCESVSGHGTCWPLCPCLSSSPCPFSPCPISSPIIDPGLSDTTQTPSHPMPPAPGVTSVSPSCPCCCTQWAHLGGLWAPSGTLEGLCCPGVLCMAAFRPSGQDGNEAAP